MKSYFRYIYKNLPPWFWEILKKGGWDNFSGYAITLVLQQHPQLHPHFDLSQLSGWQIALVLRYQPQLHPLLDLKKLDGYDIAMLLRRQPQLQNLFPSHNV